MLLVLSFMALGDQVVGANGDPLTGQIVKFDGKTLRGRPDRLYSSSTHPSAAPLVTVPCATDESRIAKELA